MASKRTKNAAAADEIDELFEGIGDEATAPKKTTKTKAGAKKTGGGGGAGKDILAELENELEDKPISRPHTPRIKDIAAGSGSGSKASPAARRAAAGTPPPDAVSLPRRSADSAKSALAAELVLDHKEQSSPSPSPPTAGAAGAAGSGWWGGLLSTASAAMKQAEAAVKEIQQNEEAKKWAEQVRGNYSALRGYGDELRHRALPTFTDILHTLAPPIASHERLLIHITHDMVGYPSLDPLVHGVFSRVMAQVEGGDLMVIQRGQENAVRASSSSSASERNFLGGSGSGSGGGSAGGGGGGAAGWRDGPWWRAVDSPRDLGAVPGLHAGTKLCRASAEAYAREYHAATGGLDEARHRAVEPMSESNPVRRSDLFLAVQAVLTTTMMTTGASHTQTLFSGSTAAAAAAAASAAAAAKKAAAAAASKNDDDDEEDESEEEEEDDDDDDDDDESADVSEEMVSFAVYVLDPVHEIVFSTVSQEFPSKWTRWLDAPANLTPTSSVDEGAAAAAAAAASAGMDDDYERVPDDIREIIEGGGVDPREWVAEWVEEALTLAVGVVAQRYVARRMGVGLGSIGKGKRPMDAVIADGGGEAARAGLI